MKKPKVHYFCSYSESRGRIAACGMWPLGIWRFGFKDSGIIQHTGFKRKVTCKNCLRVLKARKK